MMELSETSQTDARVDNRTETNVETSTLSTRDDLVEATRDGSVASAITDPSCLEGQVASEVGFLVADVEPSLVSVGVPSQVALQEPCFEHHLLLGASDFKVSSNQEQAPIIVTTLPLEMTEDGKSVVSTSVLPDPPSTLKVDVSSGHARSMSLVEEGDVGHDDPAPSKVQADYIASPEIQNAIVERSPGGRYVRFLEKLGSGASKDVYRAYDTQEGIEVAWNVVNLAGVPKTERNRIVNEVRLLERLHHHNIISFHGSWVNRERQEVIFVTEILSSGTLKSFINKVQVIRWKIAKRWAVQILKGLEYLHSQEPPVIHRDLKCENIFINGTSGDLRIGDLGLSTVHRNGRVLSVLGTPEFMAPDMYEEGSYDESVDIYAFGMCMLEIFTKEIPYSECSNPAQIYKKVSNGELPEVLSRLQSRHAREFVMLCLGFKDSSGTYVRPSASDLLSHPFLFKRDNDEDEVLVDPPLRERMISEAACESTAISGSTASEPLQSSEALPTSASPATALRKRGPSMNSIDEEDTDRFEEMPESETNIRKVKVLMGRGQELEDDDQRQAGALTESASGASERRDHTSPRTPIPAQLQQEQAQFHYLVAAAVIEFESPTVRPYADDILKLVVTLPVDGQTQNVQFDFHLVEDDPVKVAKEMVQELGIPQGAVLEIGETISALACAARMKQDKYAVRMQSTGQMQTNSTSQPPLPIQHQEAATGFSSAVVHPVQEYSNSVVIPQQTQLPSTMAEHQSLPIQQQAVMPTLLGQIDFASVQQTLVQPNQTLSAEQVPAPHEGVAGSFVYSQVERSSIGTLNPTMNLSSQKLSADTRPPSHSGSQSVGFNELNSVPYSVVDDNPPPSSSSIPFEGAQSDYKDLNASYLETHGMESLTTPSEGYVGAGRIAVNGADPTSWVADPNAPYGTHNAAANISLLSTEMSHHAPITQLHDIASTDGYSGSIPMTATEGYEIPGPPHQTSPEPLEFGGTNQYQEGSLENVATGLNYVHGTSAVPRTSGLEGDELEDGISNQFAVDGGDVDVEEELRKLDEDFQKNLQRAKKVFDNRMDNLQRSQVEREAQHLKTVEKHAKERLEFEKRLAQEEEQQNKRLEQLQREWDRKREFLAQRKAQPARYAGKNGIHGYKEPSAEAADLPSGPNHSRNTSNASVMSISPQISDHKSTAELTGQVSGPER